MKPMKPCRDCKRKVSIEEWNYNWGRCRPCDSKFVPKPEVPHNVYKLPGKDV